MGLEPYFNPSLVEAGVDEAGRGALAGPVFAAAVILPADFDHPKLNDSKKLTESDRNELRPLIESAATSWAVASIGCTEIDEINILNASIKAMHLAINKLALQPEHLLIDGNRFKPYEWISHSCMIKGDGRFRSIAAASILAKTHRDEHMAMLHQEVGHYHWHTNKGYPTRQHRESIAKYGPSPHHRKSFKLLADG